MGKNIHSFKFFKNPTLLLTVSILLSSSAALSSPAGFDDKACSVSDSAFEVPTLISKASNNFSGQCVDSNRFRPAVIISKSDSALTFENYLHENKYWRAELSRNAKVESVFVQIIRFNIVSGVTAAHVQIRFKLKEGNEIKLSSESETVNVDDIIISFEAARPKNVGYNFALGIVDNYLLVGRIASGAQRLSEYDEENKTEQYKLKLEGDDSIELLQSAIQLSHDSRMERFYNTLKPNCTTEIFDLIDSLPSQQLNGSAPFLTMISNDPVAGPTIDGLNERRLLEKRVANLREELESGASDAPEEVIENSGQFSLLAKVEGYPYSIVLAVPETVNLDKSQKESLREAKKLAYNMAPNLIQRLSSSLMLSGTSKTSSLLSSLKDLSPPFKI